MRGTHLCWYSLQLLNGKRFFLKFMLIAASVTVLLDTVMTIGVVGTYHVLLYEYSS